MKVVGYWVLSNLTCNSEIVIQVEVRPSQRPSGQSEICGRALFGHTRRVLFRLLKWRNLRIQCGSMWLNLMKKDADSWYAYNTSLFANITSWKQAVLWQLLCLCLCLCSLTTIFADFAKFLCRCFCRNELMGLVHTSNISIYITEENQGNKLYIYRQDLIFSASLF